MMVEYNCQNIVTIKGEKIMITIVSWNQKKMFNLVNQIIVVKNTAKMKLKLADCIFYK